MMAFKDVKAKFGQKQGETIYHEKKAKEANKGKDDDTTYFMKHPDCKDQDNGYVQTYLFFLVTKIHCFFLIGGFGKVWKQTNQNMESLDL